MSEIHEVHALGELAVVIGGGNIFFVASPVRRGIERATADYMGHARDDDEPPAPQAAIERHGVQTRVLSAPRMKDAEPYIRRRATRHLEKGGHHLRRGTGKPVLHDGHGGGTQAVEIGADIVCKATKVDGIYDSIPCST